MLVVEVLAPLGEADGGEAFVVEAGVVAAAEEAVAAEDEHGVEGGDELDEHGCGRWPGRGGGARCSVGWK